MKNNYFRIFVSDLAEYDNGHLNGEWLDLPLSYDELNAALNRIAVNEDDELFITDFENSYSYDVNEYDDIDELNDLAEKLDDLDDEETAVFEACIDNGMDGEEALETVESRDYYSFPGVHDMSDVAREYIEETGLLNRIPDDLQCYFDYEAYGRDMEIEGTFIDTDYGYIELLN